MTWSLTNPCRVCLVALERRLISTCFKCRGEPRRQSPAHIFSPMNMNSKKIEMPPPQLCSPLPCCQLAIYFFKIEALGGSGFRFRLQVPKSSGPNLYLTNMCMRVNACGDGKCHTKNAVPQCTIILVQSMPILQGGGIDTGCASTTHHSKSFVLQRKKPDNVLEKRC